MASDIKNIEYILEQLSPLGNVRARKMFGDYSLYINDKPVALVCDDIVYVKQQAYLFETLSACDMASPYEGAKPHYIIDFVDNRERFCKIMDLIQRYTPQKNKKSFVK